MATTRTYINDQQVMSEVTCDMMAMMGFEDTEETKYIDITDIDHPVEKTGPMSAKHYLVYYGNENVFITVSKNRNLLVFIKNDFEKDERFKGYDYITRMFTFSSRRTELFIPSIGLYSTAEDDEIHITFQLYDKEIVDIYLSINL